MQKFEMLRAKVNGDATLQEKIKGGTSFMDVAKSAGIDISQSELDAGLNALNSADAELSDFELEMIAGGSGNLGPGPGGHGPQSKGV